MLCNDFFCVFSTVDGALEGISATGGINRTELQVCDIIQVPRLLNL